MASSIGHLSQSPVAPGGDVRVGQAQTGQRRHEIDRRGTEPQETTPQSSMGREAVLGRLKWGGGHVQLSTVRARLVATRAVNAGDLSIASGG